MARSNGPLTPPGSGRQQRPDPQSWAQGTPPRQAAPRGPQQHPQQPQQPFSPQSASAAYQQAAYGGPSAGQDPRMAAPRGQQPQSAHADPRTAPPQQRQAAPSSSAFDALAAQAPSHHGGHYDQSEQGQGGYPSLGTPQQHGYGDAGSYANGPSGDYDQAAYGQWGGGAADARGFDYGGYAGGPAPQQPNGQGFPHQAKASPQPSLGHTQANDFDHLNIGAGDYQGHDEWGHNDGYDQPGHHDPEFGHQGYGDQAGAIEQSYADDDEYDDEEAPPRRRLPLIAAAVTGALLFGGGMAYGYKTFLGPVDPSATPLIKTDSIPSKVKPDDPGGRKFAHSENKIMGGSNKVMGEPLGGGSEAGPSNDGARKVQTVEVRPDGTVVPSTASASASPFSGTRPVSPSNPDQTDIFDFPAAGDAASGSPRQVATTTHEAPPSSPSPQVIARAEPQAAPSPPPQQQAAPAPRPEPQRQRVAAASPAPSQPTGPAPTGAGWVAVLASIPVSSTSQIDSLKQFADMQQKYGDVLQGKTPSVQEANLGDRGTYHRLVVGPPASRDSASSLCVALKSAGYKDCWVLQY